MKAITGRTPSIRARRQRVVQLYATTPCSQIAKELGVPRSTIEGDCCALGLLKTQAQRALAHGAVPWDDAHLEILQLMRPVMKVREIAALLGRPEKSVASKVSALGLKKEKWVKPKAPKARKPPPVRVLKEAVAKPVAAPTYRGPPPMTAAQRAAHEKTRITYTPEALPWKAHRMFAPMAGIPDLSYRGQAARN